MSPRNRASTRRAAPLWLQHVRAGATTWAWAAGLILGVGLFVTLWLGAYIGHSPYCWVSSVDVQVEPHQRWIADPRIGYRLHPAVHILRADLGGLAEAIRREHPQLAKVVVSREWPGRLVAHVALREPVGQIQARQYYLVSADGTVLSAGSIRPWQGVPVLVLGPRTKAYQPGESCVTADWHQAMDVMGEVQHAPSLRGHRVSTVQVLPTAATLGSAPLVTVVLDNGLELRAAPGDLGPRLARLGDLMQPGRPELAQAQYVDLRFDDLVIGLRADHR